MREYIAFYKGKRVELSASSSYEAQLKAAAAFRLKNSWHVAIVLADVPVDPASL